MVIEKGHGQTWDLEIIHLLQDRQVKLVACVAGASTLVVESRA